ncbi:hypothetical protein FFK22_021470 [Mycobacterium sp. KBS0706]|uniref:hypothetical protein n=1 Tax=Mycobacterium sp. KBS0706 TaxID=2578109 RepID=UPI00110FA178|nr:hypothetical protein [Mycobacterium sp. KBS0706]TSD86603.1 hypothetical protein FFK22_021470 [Mycobacterium sp. KBS0706]
MAVLFRTVVVVAGVFIVGGCSSDRVVVEDINPLYSSAEFFAAADGRDLRTTVLGNPFGTPGFDQAVTALMTGTPVGPKTRFTTTPGPSANRDYSVTVVFNPSPDILAVDLCNVQSLPTAATKRPIVARAAFCAAGGEASAVSGYLDQATGPADPKFTALIRDMTLQLFPR